MAFPNIKTDEPKGSDRVSTIDDRERETRGWLVQSLQQITGYPDCPYIKIGRWTQYNRPTNPITNVFGYNTTSKRLECWTGSAWESLQVDATGVNVDSATHAENADQAERAKRDWQNDIIHEKYLKIAGGTMTGGLVISNSSPTVDAKTTALTRGSAPGSNLSRSPFTIKDSANNVLSAINKTVNTNTSSWTYLIDYDHQDGTQHYIGVGHDQSGNWKTYAPTPAANSNDTTIATSAFVQGLVNTALASANANTNDKFNLIKDYGVLESIGANGYIQFNSGLVIEWGSVAAQSQQDYGHSRATNLPKALSAIYYCNDGIHPINSPFNYYYMQQSYTLTFNGSQVIQTANPHDDGDGGQAYPRLPAYRYIVVGHT